MNENSYLTAYPLPSPVAIWIKKPWQIPRLTYISLSNINAMTINNGHAHHFGLHNPQVLANRFKLYGSLLTTPPPGSTASFKKPTNYATQHTYPNMSIKRPRISPRRFTAYSVASVLLLPLFLIVGREDTKLNKVPLDEA